ncbi:DNA methylase [Chloracidobacterium validum]|uniref:Methyltransferase n=2 Tax=Chloracidobacterium validum TaxID=2821543 RepID=A0ABX8BE92_9BACT|nr:DNA methylase [Chloracidobacterium validum]
MQSFPDFGSGSCFEEQRHEAKGKKKQNPINDLDLENWKSLTDIWTDSLWLIPSRDKSGAHTAEYHGNFVPQIPRQVIQRYTKRGDVVLDAFLGSGTTLIESQRCGRHGIGIELLSEVAHKATARIALEPNRHGIQNHVIIGDSSSPDIKGRIVEALERIGRDLVDLVMLHPPYHDIIKFSDSPDDLSNQATVAAFCEALGRVIENTTEKLRPGRFLIIVIGDKYADSAWIPLGFYVMQEALKREFILKSIVVKDMQGNRAKQNQEQLWRYRALLGGFYVFRHEYVFVLKKKA